MRAKRRYWDKDLALFGEQFARKNGGYVDSDPLPSVEDEIFGLISRLEDERSLTPEIVLGLECLTPKQRFAVDLRYGLSSEGPMTEREIARMMGITHRAVQKLIKRALRRLEKEMWGVVKDVS